MADPCFTAQVVLHRDSGLARDDIVNVWHFQGDPTAGGIGSERERWDNLSNGLAGRLKTFYQAISTKLAKTVDPSAAVIKLYDMRDPKPQLPRYQETFALGLTANDSMPNEVALCLSMRAEAVPGVNMRRRRGRVYLGPFGWGQMLGTEAGADHRPSAMAVGQILDAAAALATGVSGSARLAVYSPTTDVTESLDDALNDVKHLWIDDAWDTQRRRGASATTRQTRTVG